MAQADKILTSPKARLVQNFPKCRLYQILMFLFVPPLKFPQLFEKLQVPQDQIIVRLRSVPADLKRTKECEVKLAMALALQSSPGRDNVQESTFF